MRDRHEQHDEQQAEHDPFHDSEILGGRRVILDDDWTPPHPPARSRNVGFAPAFVTLTTVGLLAGAVYFWRRQRAAAPSSGAPSGDAPTPAPKPSGKGEVPTTAPAVAANDQTPTRLPKVADALRKVAGEVLGRDLTDNELALVLGQAWLETGAGGWWPGALKGSSNLGAMQCTSAEQKAGASQPYYTCVEGSDKHSDGKSYAIKFRYYRDHAGKTALEWSAFNFLSRVKGSLERSDGTPESYAAELKKTRYYEGFGATEEERIAGYASALRTRALQAAKQLGLRITWGARAVAGLVLPLPERLFQVDPCRTVRHLVAA